MCVLDKSYKCFTEENTGSEEFIWWYLFSVMGVFGWSTFRDGALEKPPRPPLTALTALPCPALPRP